MGDGTGNGHSLEMLPVFPDCGDVSRTPSKRSHLLGIGLDGADGHKRLTRADDFSIVGGSEETHERMTETLVKTFESLRTRGHSLDTVGKKELADLLAENSPD